MSSAKLYNFSQIGQTPFALDLKYFIGEKILDNVPDEKVQALIDEILSKEKGIIEETDFFSDYGTSLGKNSLTSRSNNYNLLWFDNAEWVLQSISMMHELYVKACGAPFADSVYYCHSWANVMRDKEKIFPHRHSGDSHSYLSGHLCLQVDGTHTHYINLLDETEWKSPNANKKITMFPSFIKHYTDRVPVGQVRITLAFDIIGEGSYNYFRDSGGWDGNKFKDNYVKLIF